ncbi:MAG: ABZJ_00895 family protein [Pelagimonas sp.]|jgi:hypothetical protein|nr:ABZJ_00895 family protein [Pelagimonas sp.]
MQVDLQRYATHFALALLGIWLLSLGLDYLGTRLPSGFASIAPAMLAAQFEGFRLAKEYNRPFAPREAWRLAIPLTLVGIGINLMLTLGYFLLVSGDQAMEILALLGAFGWLMVFVIAGLVIWVTNRIFLGMGLRAQLKRQG